MKRSAWNKNNRRELRKTLGRFLAIVAIVALGVGFFTGLKSARPSMAQTCDAYLADTAFYDLQLISSIGFDPDAAEAFRTLDGVAAARGSVSADLLALQGDTEVVFKTHMLLPDLNLVKLTAGRMPEAPNECLADDLTFGPDFLGQSLTVKHQEETVFSQDSYTIVGLCNSPLYLNLDRGTTSLGTGAVTGFLFLPEDGYDTDYFTEVFLRLEGTGAHFEDGYTETLEQWEEPLLAILELQGQNRLDRILEDARTQLDEGWQEYHDGREEYETARADAEAELEEARQALEDAAAQLADGRAELEAGEAELARLQADPYSNPQLAEARTQLDEGWAQLEAGEAEYESGKAQFQAMEGPLRLVISEARSALEPAQASLDQRQAAHADAQAEFDRIKAQLDAQQEALYAPVAQLEQQVREAEALVDQLEAEQDRLREEGAGLLEQTAAAMAAEAARAELRTRQAAYETAKAAYEAQHAALQSQLEGAQTAMDTTQALLDEAQALVDQLNATITDGEQQLADAQRQLLEAKVQIEESRAMLEEGEATLQQELTNALTQARAQLDSGWAELTSGQAEYDSGLAEYEDGKSEAEKEFARAEKELAAAHRELLQAELDLKRMEDPSYFVLTPTSNNGFVSFDNDTNIVEGIARVFPLFFFLVAALVCSSTMTRMVEEQRTQNGTLKALGYADDTILMRYAVYAGSAALIGSGLGLLIGTYLFPFVIWEAYKLLYHFGELRYHFNLGMAAISVAAALLCSVGAAALAAWNDLQRMPAQLMRPKAPKAGKRIFLEHIKPLWNSLGFLAKVSLRNIFRYKKRLFMMLLGTGGCLALLLAGLGLRDSISNVADDQFGSITMYDFTVTFDEHQTEEEQAAFQAEFAGQLDTCVFAGTSALKVSTDRGNKSVSVVACSDRAIDDMLGLHADTGDLGYPTGDGMFISNALAEDAGLQVGDLLPLQLETNDVIEIPITGIFVNYVNHYAFLTEEGYETWFGIAPEIRTVYATTGEEDQYAVAAALQAGEGVLNVTMTQMIRDTVGNAMSSLDAIVILVVACAVALSFVVGYNLININITERVREIATIKVLGFYRNETHAYVFRESILLTLMGTVVGVPLGIWLHRFIMTAVRVDFVCFQIQIAPLSYVLGIAITLLSTLLVNWILGKKIDRINMAESLKSVE